jgi:membrane protease YdiL (CAAX protease family)
MLIANVLRTQPMNLVARVYRRLFLDMWESINRDAEAERARHPGFDARPMIVLVLAALVLIFQEYYGDRPNFEEYFGRYVGYSRWYQLYTLAWWAGAKVVGYLCVPALTVWLALRGRLRDYGMTIRGLRRHVWIYVALYAAIVPIIVAASSTHAFQATYPFYREASRSWRDLVAWELMYAATFFSLEFFFRGFLLFALERTMGAYAIFVTIVPYCMIHFHKPVAEVVGAIFAGIVLGTLAMVTRSIWCGVLIHVSVAWTMDLLALARSGTFPRLR